MLNHFFSVYSHVFGRNSKVANVLGRVAEISLNLILAVVCLGYVAQFIGVVFPVLSGTVAFMISGGLLLCAVPFELLNIDVQRRRVATDSNEWALEHPMLAQSMALVSAVLGSIQYFIRNFSMVFNFAVTRTGTQFLRHASKVKRLSVGSFATLGGVAGFVAHFLLAACNWDKFLFVQGSNSRLEYAAILIWCIPLLLFLPVIGSYGIVISASLGLVSFGVVKACQYVIPWESVQAAWLEVVSITLPLGALLYALMDFYNSSAIMTRMGWKNIYAQVGCLLFAALSWVNISLLWGYNTATKMNKGVANWADQRYPGFVKRFYVAPSIRRVVSYSKEVLLCGLDILNNQLMLSSVNWVTSSFLGFTVALWVLNMCTVAFALNRMVVLYFQSNATSASCVSDYCQKKTENTWMAQTCSGIVNAVEIYKTV